MWLAPEQKEVTVAAEDSTIDVINYLKNNMNTGNVKFFNEEKGFGFIKDTNSSKEYFVHSTGLKDFVTEGDKVNFDLQEGQKGLNAVNVKRV
jgi:cold shock protein